jgi:hypothetical protein
MMQTKTNLPTLAELTKSATKSAQRPAATGAASMIPVNSVPSTSAAAEPQAWTDSDEAAFRLMQQRRKNAGHKGRGANINAQLLCVGSIKPNGNTVASAIVGLLPAKGTITRGELLARMAATDFTSKNARPEDKGWCQGYVAGAIRSGFVDTICETSVKIIATVKAV